MKFDSGTVQLVTSGYYKGLQQDAYPWSISLPAVYPLMFPFLTPSKIHRKGDKWLELAWNIFFGSFTF